MCSEVSSSIYLPCITKCFPDALFINAEHEALISDIPSFSSNMLAKLWPRFLSDYVTHIAQSILHAHFICALLTKEELKNVWFYHVSFSDDFQQCKQLQEIKPASSRISHFGIIKPICISSENIQLIHMYLISPFKIRHKLWIAILFSVIVKCNLQFFL